MKATYTPAEVIETSPAQITLTLSLDEAAFLASVHLSLDFDDAEDERRDSDFYSKLADALEEAGQDFKLLFDVEELTRLFSDKAR